MVSDLFKLASLRPRSVSKDIAVKSIHAVWSAESDEGAISYPDTAT